MAIPHCPSAKGAVEADRACAIPRTKKKVSALLIPDSGPLFSLAACGRLELLDEFNVVITDVVHWETALRATSGSSSFEARTIAAFLSARPEIAIQETTVGRLARGADLRNVRNLGELSIQSFLIDLRASSHHTEATILFEDQWVVSRMAHFPSTIGLVSTSAFLIGAEELGLIESAAEAIVAIQVGRPTSFFSEKVERQR